MVPLPDWLALGLAIAAGLTVVFATVFALAERLFPSTPRTTEAGTDGEWKRRAEIRDYLGTIGEPYQEDSIVHGHPVAFYLPERDVAITFDGPTYFRLERTETHPILIEHEMPGGHLGTRLPFDTPRPDPQRQRDGTDSGATAFDVLGVSPDATPEEITTAYRRRIKEVHPDHGGDEEQFHRVREAYTIARDAVE